MHGLIDKERNLETEKQRLYGLAVRELASVTRTMDVKRTTFRRKVVWLMKKATKSSLAATECRRQFDEARTALAECREQLRAKLDAAASTVYSGLTKIWGTLHLPYNCARVINSEILSRRPLKRTK